MRTSGDTQWQFINKLTIGKRLTFGFAGVILITLCLSVYAFTRLEAIQSQASSLAKDSLPGAVLMGQIAALSEREVALVLQHIKANDAQEVQKMDEELRENHEKLSALFKAYEATVFGAEEAERFQRLNTTLCGLPYSPGGGSEAEPRTERQRSLRPVRSTASASVQKVFGGGQR